MTDVPADFEPARVAPFSCGASSRPSVLLHAGHPAVPDRPPGALEHAVVPVERDGRIVGWLLAQTDDWLRHRLYNQWVRQFTSTWRLGTRDGVSRFWESATRFAHHANRALGVWGTIDTGSFDGEGLRLQGQELTILAADLRVLAEVLPGADAPGWVCEDDDGAIICGEVLVDEWGDPITVGLLAETDGAVWVDAAGCWLRQRGGPARLLRGWSAARIDGALSVLAEPVEGPPVEVGGSLAYQVLALGDGNPTVRFRPGTAGDAWAPALLALTAAVSAARRDRTPLHLHVDF